MTITWCNVALFPRMFLLLQSAGRRVPFAFLEDIKGQFLTSYGSQWQQVG